MVCCGGDRCMHSRENVQQESFPGLMRCAGVCRRWLACGMENSECGRRFCGTVRGSCRGFLRTVSCVVRCVLGCWMRLLASFYCTRVQTGSCLICKSLFGTCDKWAFHCVMRPRRSWICLSPFPCLSCVAARIFAAGWRAVWAAWDSGGPV